MKMTPRNWLFQYLVALIAGLGAAIGCSSPSAAFVNQIVIDSVNTANYNPIPLGSSTPSTTAVNYTIYTGRIFGLLDPTNPLNAGITDINLASWSGFPSAAPNGMVQYVSQFSIVTPTTPAQRSGLIIFEVSNRGGNAITTTALVQGATYVQSGWQGDQLSQCSGVSPSPAPPPLYPCVNLSNPTPGYGAGGGAYGTATASFPFYAPPDGLADSVIQVPVATTDGTPALGYTGNTNPNNIITGSVYSHIQAPCAGFPSCGYTQKLIIYGSSFTPFQMAGYSPSSPSPYGLTTTGATFMYSTAQSTTGVDTGQTTIPNSQWSWAYCPNGPTGAGYTPDPFYICLNNGGTFNSSYLYEISFPAQDPLVQGVGWASTRDFVSFLRYGTTAPGGGTNPVAGTITKGLIIGVSQSGNYIRSLIFYGFNQDESGRIVFDGGWNIISSRNLWMMPRWSQPTVILNLYQGGNESPIWWSDFPNQARNLPAAGLLDRCNATTPNTCPQELETWGGNEYFINKTAAVSIGFCPGTTCALTSDIPQPANVYRYYVPGASHGGGTVSFNWSAPPTTPVSATATYNTSPIPETYSNNALQSAFIQHLMNGTPMPPSGPGITYPGWAAGQLAPSTNQAAVGFPNIPAVPYAGNQAWPPFVYNFGPGEDYANQSGIITIQPPTISSVLTAYIPTQNADGNDNGGGIPSVLFQAPLATYMDWNVYPAGTPYAGQDIQLNGGYYPFWDTKAHRSAADDPRLSLEERYGTNTGYKCVAQQAVANAVEQGFLLPSDATLLRTGTSGTLTLAAPINTSNVLASGSPGFVPTTADVALAHNILCGLTSTHDFNGDYKSDILWRDASGNVGMWLMNGSAVSQASVLGNVPGNWSIVGQRDFNGDGNADILWRDTSGNVGLWLMNGTSVTSSTVLGNVPTTWSVAATGDFNGDGKADIVWRDTSGNVGLWLMNGATIQQASVIGNLSTNWMIAGADNHGHIFWRNAVTGDVGMWTMSGATITQSVDFGPVPLSWAIAGTGDFDGNGSTDILWRDSSGDVGIWLLNGNSVTSTAVVGNVPLNWTIAQTGDYSGSGMSDILWTDSAGDVGAWFMNGTTISSTTIYGNIGTAWGVQSQGAD
jgi:hypothetical protein